MSKFKPAEFEMTESFINSFQRKIPKPMDCVINALQLMGALSPRCAELMRIVAGDGGFQKKQIEDTFKFLFPSKQWEFQPFSNLNELAYFTKAQMTNGRVVFCGYVGYNPTLNKSTGHVFLIGKNLQGTVLYLDPQIPTICDLDDAQCANYISGKNQYFILQYCCGAAIKGGGKRRRSPRGRLLKKSRRRSRPRRSRRRRSRRRRSQRRRRSRRKK
jgi:hypothetical protein